FDDIQHNQGTAELSAVWGRSDGAVFAVGWGGLIISNAVTKANPNGVWGTMQSNTTENLTGIVGTANGASFGLPAQQGEQVAVGWHGTVLHYHPNPDQNKDTEDGVWQVVAAPGGPSFVPLLLADPACPDYDGDGIADDGNRDGWAGDALCTGGNYTNCDDNCR